MRFRVGQSSGGSDGERSTNKDKLTDYTMIKQGRSLCFLKGQSIIIEHVCNEQGHMHIVMSAPLPHTLKNF